MTIFLYLFLIFLTSYFIFFVMQFYYIIFEGYAPLYSSRKNVVKKVIDEIKIENGLNIYELGCGKASFLRAIEKKFTDVNLIGVEVMFLVYLLTGVQLMLQKSKVKLIRKSFFDINLKEADVIYCYLNNLTMKKLGEKIRNECKSGSQIVSYRFPILEFEPAKVISEEGKNIYFYKI